MSVGDRIHPVGRVGAERDEHEAGVARARGASLRIPIPPFSFLPSSALCSLCAYVMDELIRWWAHSTRSATLGSRRSRADSVTRRTQPRCVDPSRLVLSYAVLSRLMSCLDDVVWWCGVVQYTARAGNFVNNWNPNVTVPGNASIKGMMQVRASLLLSLLLSLASLFVDWIER